jgi:hypothetical protein
MKPRPLSITLIGWLFIASGALGFAYHAGEFRTDNHVASELIWILIVRLLAIVGGVLMLRGSDWGRWVVLAWMLYHVVLSAFHSTSELVTHAVILVAIASVLLRPGPAAYFRGTRRASP